ELLRSTGELTTSGAGALARAFAGHAQTMPHLRSSCGRAPERSLGSARRSHREGAACRPFDTVAGSDERVGTRPKAPKTTSSRVPAWGPAARAAAMMRELERRRVRNAPRHAENGVEQSARVGTGRAPPP